jgi:hypothetical protein
MGALIGALGLAAIMWRLPRCQRLGHRCQLIGHAKVIVSVTIMQVMRWRRHSHSTDCEQADGFDWREIACASGDAAKAEAERQQSLDTRDAEWIYLRNASGQWVARRTPRDLQAPPISMRRAFLEWLTNPFDLLGS